MNTSEGKTLTIGLAAYLSVLRGKSVIDVNDVLELVAGTEVSGFDRVIAGDSHLNGNDVAVVWADGATSPTALGSLGGPGSYAFAISADVA